MRALAWLLLALGALAGGLDAVRWERAWPWRLAATQDKIPAPEQASFQSPGVYRTTDARLLPTGLAVHGSWIESDAFVGRHDTGWFQARRTCTVLLAGYPALAPNRLDLEIRHRDGRLSLLPYAGANPGESWQPWHLSLPDDAVAFRLRATDASTAARGWLAFSEPFVDLTFFARPLWPLVQLTATTCLAIVLLYGPGLWWLHRRQRTPADLAIAILAGPVLIFTLGLACWALGGWVAPVTIARIGIGALLLFLGTRLWRRPGPLVWPDGSVAVIAAGGLLVGFAVAKANVSVGPKGELFGGTVSRTLAVGGHSDSRTSYHLVQLVAHHAGPFSAEAESYYSPWSVANRGPMGGLIAAPIVLATGGDPRRDAVNQPWRPFDEHGFATYRISQIVLASLAGWAVFGATAALLPTAWALFAATLALLAPFFVHEMYFTWPKLATGGFVLAAFVLAHTRRPVSAGLTLGLAYLLHPVALFSIPLLSLWMLARAWRRAPGWTALAEPARFGFGLLPCLVPWALLGRWAPLRTGSQTVFLDFFRLSDGKLATEASAWWLSRWHNFAHTFVPLHLLTADRSHESLNSVYGPSDAWVQAGFLYWNTLPFALGAPAFLLLAPALVAGCRRAFATLAVTVIGPALFLIVYWGAASTGLMRHCGQVLFVSVIVTGTWALTTHAGSWRRPAVRALLHPACFAWRGGEVLLVAFGTTFWPHRPNDWGPWGWNDGASLVLALGCLAGAVILLAKTAAARMNELFPTESSANPPS